MLATPAVANAKVGVPNKVTVSPSIFPDTVGDPETVAVTPPSNSLFMPVRPVIVIAFGAKTTFVRTETAAL